MRRQLNLDIRAQRQLMHRNTRPNRLRILAENLRIYLVHSGEILHVGQKDVDFDDVVDGWAGGGQDGGEVREGLFLFFVC